MITESLSTALSTAFTAVQTGVTDIVTLALPVGLAIMGLMLAIRIGINFFRSIAGKR